MAIVLRPQICDVISPYLYLPPSSSDIEDLISQLPSPVVLLGDFNAHNKDWGCSENDSKGKIIGDLMLQHNLSLLNDVSATYLYPRSASHCAIDLSDPSLYFRFLVEDPQ